MSQEFASKTPAERLLSLMLLNDKVKDGYLITKRLETETTVIQIIHRVEGKRAEEHLSNHIFGE